MIIYPSLPTSSENGKQGTNDNFIDGGGAGTERGEINDCNEHGVTARVDAAREGAHDGATMDGGRYEDEGKALRGGVINGTDMGGESWRSRAIKK